MLDTDTKRRIDTARDILVGKVPDPKSQVEQITIALIYKFMDDMDADSEELGGSRKFFANGYARYGWAKLMRSGLGGHETLNLYAEAIAKMPENPGIPPLFRDIFKNAYLPYRDPETLRAFLKIIDEFEYDHSERLGDAFEYLLSVLGSQGDAGQFRTPRHIIDFIVAVVDPKKTETVLDPACGTAGFLISSWKHILKANTDADGHSTLTPDDRGRLAQNFKGYDISPDMVRLSLVNLYLHGFTDPHIFEYDTLTSQERWNEYADVILANPPFMSPKGGIRPHNRFSVQSKRSEVLFVDYMAEHLTPGGRAGIIVPEGIIFQSGAAYRKLREMLIHEFLVGVISLPSGVFMPYTGVKTSILILDRVAAKRMPSILFSEIKHIGVSLGVKRTPSEHNDLPTVLRDYRAFYDGGALSRCSWVGSRKEILANDCNLTGSRYRPAVVNGNTRLVKIADICTITKGTSSSTKTSPGPYPLILTAAEPKTSAAFQFDLPAVCVPLISSLGHGKAALHRIHFASGKFALANLLVALQPKDVTELDARFLFHALNLKRDELAGLMRGAANVSMKPEDLAQFDIPLPPLEVQNEIVAEIEGYQRIMDGARAVLDNYRSHIPIHADWPMVELGSTVDILDSQRRPITKHDRKPGPYPYYGATGILDHVEGYLFDEPLVLVGEDGAKWGAGENTAYAISGKTWVNNHAHVLRPIREKLMDLFLITALNAMDLSQYITGVTVPKLNQEKLRGIPIPLPPLATQQAIVAEIEAEQALVAANRELITRFEKKIQATFARVWDEDEPAPSEA
jgi:type I restriction enzyme M protein